MALILIGERDIPKGSQTYTVRLFFDKDTNTQRHEYILDNEILYFIEYEVPPLEEPEKDANVDAIANGFEIWYEQVGPDWRPGLLDV